VTKSLTLLGSQIHKPIRKLETFPNSHPERKYTVTLTTDEFTCKCPVTNQPDFATITFEYIPKDLLLETKSLKLYLWSFREEGIFSEHVVNRIFDDLVSTLQPRWAKIEARFAPRGGISITVTCETEKL